MDIKLRVIICPLNDSYHRTYRPYLITPFVQTLFAAGAHLTAGQFVH
jgi:hypothetical protein